MSTKYSPEELYKLKCDLERGMISAIIAPGAKASSRHCQQLVKQTITIRHMEASINQTRLKDNFSDYLSGHFGTTRCSSNRYTLANYSAQTSIFPSSSKQKKALESPGYQRFFIYFINRLVYFTCAASIVNELYFGPDNDFARSFC